MLREKWRNGRAKLTIAVFAVITTLALAAFVASQFSLVGAVIVIGVAAVIFVLTDSENATRRSLASKRRDDNYLDFARSVENLEADPMATRAIYEELLDHLGYPIRAEDRVKDGLGIGEDRLWDVLVEIAARCERDLSDYLDERAFSHLETVADIVDFVSELPRTPRR